MRVTKSETHERVTHAVLEWSELRRMLIRATGLDPDELHPATEIKVRLQQQTEGSPAYAVDRWTASISVKENLS